MQRFLIILVLLIAAATAYLYLQRTQDQPPAPPVSAPAESRSSVATPAQVLVTRARQHIDKIIAIPEQSIEIEKADHFVTASQLLSLPLPQVETTIQLEAVDSPNSQTFAIETGAALGSSAFIPEAPRTLTPANQIKLLALLDTPAQNDKQLYYIHAVNEGDEQGLWGIVQSGLTRTFAEGIRLSDQQDILYANIPKDADERLDSHQSSFLGRLLQSKVTTTYIYNYRSGNLGEDPNLIEPGQQLIIVSFSEDELIRVYEHFVNL
ncbi:MAG: hypothetical protein ACPGF7_03310 [Pontibacterium sp.]